MQMAVSPKPVAAVSVSSQRDTAGGRLLSGHRLVARRLYQDCPSLLELSEHIVRRRVHAPPPVRDGGPVPLGRASQSDIRLCKLV